MYIIKFNSYIFVVMANCSAESAVELVSSSGLAVAEERWQFGDREERECLPLEA
jgi:hypothetical protein